jgi:autotransporter-associated beta strand protein
MKKTLFLTTLLLSSVAAMAQNTVIDIRDGKGDNTDKSYITYDKAISVAANKTVDVKLARYCYLNSTVSGKGTVNLYAGGERCWLGTKSAWANWTSFKGDAHVHPFKENSSKAGAFLVVLNHGGKVFDPENIDECIRDGKLNSALQNCKLTVHSGAGICNEANDKNAGGFRIGELQMEDGSTLQGYMKTGRKSYYLVGSLNTDATLAGTIAPSGYNDGTLLGFVKEGTGTYRITGNNNYLTGALRVLQGRVLINNNRAEAETKKLRGGLGAKSNENEAVAYVFTKGVLGGTGSIGGAVDNYGTIEPGDDTPGTLTLKNYALPTKNANLAVHPASVLRFKVASADSHDYLDIAGILKYNNTTEEFSTSDAQPVVELMLLGDLATEVGTELPLVAAKSKSGNWEFRLKQPGKGTWMLEEKTDADGYKLVAKLVSTSDADNPDDPDNPDEPESTMGAFYDDGIDDKADTHTLRYYAEKNEKFVGGAFCTYKSYDYERAEAAKQYNMLVAENEMKMDVLQPSQGQFSYGSADALVSLAQNNKMAVRGHCLVWNQQQPEWLSGDKGKKNDKHWTRQQALDIMKDHITNVMQHFKGKVTEWDVVNECLDDDQSIIRSNPDGYKIKSSVWQLAIGDDYVDSAFVYAHRADPTAKLYLNDYDVELHGKAKTVAYYNLARHLQSQNIPIDGVGLQCHFSIGDVDSVKLEKTIQRFGEIGLKCIVTELDMGIPSTSSANLEEQARNYRVITDIMLNNDNCPSMLIWGIKDNDSWREGKNPLLYDAGMGKKRAWYAVRSALRHRYLLLSNGIESLAPASSQNESAVYDLSGRRIQGRPSRPGIYIIGGKKVIIR